MHDPANVNPAVSGIAVANPRNTDNIIEHNTIEGTYNGIAMDVSASGTVRYNLIRNVARHGLRIEYLSEWTATHNIIDGSLDAMGIREMDPAKSLNMSHNTIYDYIIGLWIPDVDNYDLENSHFNDNIFHAGASGTVGHHVQVADDIHLATSNEYKNNIFYNTHANDDAVCWGDESGTTIRTCYAGATSYSDTTAGINSFNSAVSTASGNINGDPLFKDAANGDFNLAVGSPAINAASDGKDIGAFNQPTIETVGFKGNKITIIWDVEFTPIQNCDYTKFTVTADDVGVDVNSCSDISDTQTELTLASGTSFNQVVELTGIYGCAEDSVEIGYQGVNGQVLAFVETATWQGTELRRTNLSRIGLGL